MRTISLIATARAIAAALSFLSSRLRRPRKTRISPAASKALPKNAKVVLMPTDFELFFLSASGVRSGYEDGARRLLTFQTNSWRAT